jgi:uncharacterized protein
MTLCMPHPVIEKLLILQERDARRLSLEAQLGSLPAEIQGIRAKIVAEKAALDQAKGEMRDLEAKKKVMETEIGSAETKLAKYRTQQVSVRKNDEYQALGHEIDTVTAEIGNLEEKEIELLYQIDEARKRFNNAEQTMRDHIAGHEARIKLLEERQTNLGEELAAVKTEVETARAPLGEAVCRVYDRVASRHQPTPVVALQGGKCGGCHLKVSSEVESASRARDQSSLVHCDQCGRIVWWESV